MAPFTRVVNLDLVQWLASAANPVLILMACWRPVIWFAATGAILGVFSILVTGWPLHQVFLDQLSVMSHTAILSPIVYSIDGTITQFLPPDQVFTIMSPPEGAGQEVKIAGWGAIEKSSLWMIANQISVLVLIVVGGIGLRRFSEHQLPVWAAVFTTYGLIGPLSWSHHYVTVAAMVPMLYFLLPKKWGMLAIFAVFIPISLVGSVTLMGMSGKYLLPQFAGTISMFVLLLGYLFAVRAQRQHFLP